MKNKRAIIAYIFVLSVIFITIEFIYPCLNRVNGQTTESNKTIDNKGYQGSNGKDEHKEHDEDKKHGESGEHHEEAIRLSEAELKEFGIELDKAGPGKLQTYINLPGEVAVDPDRLVHIVPRVPGIVRKVRKTLGDTVRPGEIMAVLESAELGQAKIEYLALMQQLDLARIDLARIQTIHKNTALMLNLLKDSPEPEILQEKIKGLDLGVNRSSLMTTYTTLILTRETFKREKNLYNKKISSKAELLEAERDFKSAQAKYQATYDETSFTIKRELFDKKRTAIVAESALLAAERRLHILGLTNNDIKLMLKMEKHGTQLARVEIRAPFQGTVIEKHITLGEALKDDSRAFVIADLSSVWVNLNVYQKDLPFIKMNQRVIISAGYGIPDAIGKISWVSPLVGEQTRTSLARIVLPNSEGHWLPGLFVNGKIAVGNVDVPLLIPKSAIQTIENRQSVFIKTEEGFKPKPITVGRQNSTHVEIISGLNAGQQYVKKGAFTLKAQLAKGSFGEES